MRPATEPSRTKQTAGHDNHLMVHAQVGLWLLLSNAQFTCSIGSRAITHAAKRNKKCARICQSDLQQCTHDLPWPAHGCAHASVEAGGSLEGISSPQAEKNLRKVHGSLLQPLPLERKRQHERNRFTARSTFYLSHFLVFVFCFANKIWPRARTCFIIRQPVTGSWFLEIWFECF